MSGTSLAFPRAGRTRLTNLKLGWFLVRLPDTHQQLRVLVAQDDLHPTPAVLLTNIPIRDIRQAQAIYADWRLRGRIEHGYRFDQGLDVEDVRVRTLERMRRLFALVLLTVQFVFFLMQHWPPQAVLWLRQLGGKLGLQSDRDGPYILLRGLSAVWQAATTLSWLAVQSFPYHLFGDTRDVGKHRRLPTLPTCSREWYNLTARLLSKGAHYASCRNPFPRHH